MPLDPAQRQQIEQDTLYVEWAAERLPACESATALLREIPVLQTEDGGDVVLGADATGQ